MCQLNRELFPPRSILGIIKDDCSQDNFYELCISDESHRVSLNINYHDM